MFTHRVPTDYDEHVVRQFWGRAAEGVPGLLGAPFFFASEAGRASKPGHEIQRSFFLCKVLFLPALTTIDTAPCLVIVGFENDAGGGLQFDLNYV